MDVTNVPALGFLDIAAKLLLFGWFSYVLYTHFASSGKEPLGMTLIKLASLAGLGICVWLSVAEEARPLSSLLGMLMTGLSAIVFGLAVRASKAAGLRVAFSEATGSSLVATGIYRHVRHPLYLSYIVYWLSWCMTLQFVLPSVAVLTVLLLLYGLSIRLEERELERTFGDHHRAYRKRTSLLIPYLL